MSYLYIHLHKNAQYCRHQKPLIAGIGAEQSTKKQMCIQLGHCIVVVALCWSLVFWLYPCSVPALGSSDVPLKKQVFEILAALSVYSKDGYVRAMQVLEQFKVSDLRLLKI